MFLLLISALLFILKFSPFIVIFVSIFIGFLMYRRDITKLSLKIDIPREKLRIYKYVAYLLFGVFLFNLILYMIDSKLFLLSTLMMKVDVFALVGIWVSSLYVA